MENNVGILNDIYVIKKLFTEAYYDYRFSSLFISTINNMSNMVIPNLIKIEYNDENKFLEIQRSPGEYPEALGTQMTGVLVGFISFCYDDQVMRQILTNVNLNDFKIFDMTMAAIRESQALGLQNKVMSERFIALNVFNLIPINSDLIRLNLT